MPHREHLRTPALHLQLRCCANKYRVNVMHRFANVRFEQHYTTAGAAFGGSPPQHEQHYGAPRSLLV